MIVENIGESCFKPRRAVMIVENIGKAALNHEVVT
jgi:hypothetical protein